MTAEMTNEIAVIDSNVGDVASDIRALATGNSAMYSSLRLNSFEDALTVIDVITNSEPIAEHLNKEIRVRNIVVQAIAMADERTGEVRNAPRVVLIAEDGKAYHAISNGLFRSVQNLLLVAGEPAGWPSAVPLVIKREGKAPNAYFTARIAPKK